MVIGMKRITAVSFICAGLISLAACNQTPTTPGGGQVGPTHVALVFVGTFAPGETPSNTFTVPSGAPLHLTLASLTNLAGQPLGTGVTLKFGVPPATGGCEVLSKVSGAIAQLTSQINVLTSAGTYCVGLEDTAGVPVNANYAIRAVYGTVTDIEGPGSVVWANSVLPAGSSSRSFNASADGLVTVGLDVISPPTVGSLGLGMGIPKNDGAGCELTTSVIAPVGTQFNVPVDAGKYCVKVFDPGTLTDSAAFSMRIVRP